MAWSPTASADVVHDAAADETSTFAQPAMPPLAVMNEMVPVGAAPEPVSAAVKVTGSPCAVGFFDALNAMPGVNLVANAAVTVRAALIVTLHVMLVPEHAPPHPAKRMPFAGFAVNVTVEPDANDALHEVLQPMPAGELDTDPLPVLVTVSITAGAKFAVTAIDEIVIESVQAPAPVQAPPLQPEKTDPAAGVAPSATDVRGVKAALHVAPQSIPAGALVTVPVPEPALPTAICGRVSHCLMPLLYATSKRP